MAYEVRTTINDLEWKQEFPQPESVIQTEITDIRPNLSCLDAKASPRIHKKEVNSFGFPVS